MIGFGGFRIAAEILQRRVAGNRRPEAAGVPDQRKFRKRFEHMLQPRQPRRVDAAQIVEMKQDRQFERVTHLVELHHLRMVKWQADFMFTKTPRPASL